MVAPGGAYAIRPYTGTRTNKPTGRSPQQTNIKRAHRPEWMNAQGHASAPCRGAWGAYAIRPYTGTRTNKPTGTRTNKPTSNGPQARMDERPRTCIRPVPGRLGGVCNTPLPYRQEGLRVPGKLRRRPQTPPAKFAGVRRRPRPNSPVSADTPRQMPRDLRCLRKRHGKRRETCAACANATANAERPALPAQTPRQTPRDLRGLRKRHGKRRETCAACANLLRIQNNL